MEIIGFNGSLHKSGNISLVVERILDGSKQTTRKGKFITVHRVSDYTYFNRTGRIFLNERK